ncbi:MAG: 2OG-Fe(II) oxygenase [Telmatospirillum sp.]|nr:2OG-Fe(II) oxygenase [Telmatospirillum sp.]
MNLDTLDWTALGAELDAKGFAATAPVLSDATCRMLAASYDDALFRATIAMARHGFGRGEYRYFAYPLPALVAEIRETLYARLAPIANAWHEKLGKPGRFPATHAAFLAACAGAGQKRPTPLLLRYCTGDYNCMHQDLYGSVHFPIQAAFLLSKPEADFSGGEFVLVEQRPRRQSRAHVVPLAQGACVLFAVDERPAMGTRGVYRVKMRHGVAEIRSGQRHTLGAILHDAA